MVKASGLILYFDGPDGVGKTTQLELVAKDFREAGRSVYTTRSSGGTPIGELLRTASLSNNDRPVETDFHIALACQHALIPEILARRDQGEVVLVDRSPLSIIAFQVYGDGLDRETGYKAVGELMSRIEPDAIFVYHAPSGVLEDRRRQRNGEHQLDHFEAMPADYHRRVADGFASSGTFGAHLIDADTEILAVHRATLEHLAKWLR
jgi:dTMP kinase